MADRPIPLRRLRQILARYDVQEDKKRGKGSHTLFWKQFPEGKFTYPVPTHHRDVLVVYVKGCRKRFRLRVEDGVSDEEFYAS